jgi:hypothetical protein
MAEATLAIHLMQELDLAVDTPLAFGSPSLIFLLGVGFSWTAHLVHLY